MIPQLIVAAVLLAAAFTSGWKVNGWRIASADARAQDSAEKAAAAATEAAVTAIKGIEVKYVTIKQQAETVTREKLVYRECQHDPDGLRLVNEALAGGSAAPADHPAGMPRPDAAD